MRAILLLALTAAPAVAQPKYVPPKVPCPGDFAGDYPSGTRAFDACSPKVAERLLTAHRNGRLAKLPDPAGFVRLAADHGDVVVNYVLANGYLFDKDPAAWDAFAADPLKYCAPNAPRPKAQPKEADQGFGTDTHGWDFSGKKKSDDLPPWLLYGGIGFLGILGVRRLLQWKKADATRP